MTVTHGVAMAALLLTIAAGIARAEPLVLLREARIEAGSSCEATFEWPEAPAGQQVRLSLKARLDWPAFAGHNPFLGVQVNGHAVEPEQLVSKPLEFTMNDGSDASWWGQGLWRLLYSPAFGERFEADPPAYMVADADPYLFVWNITPYARPGTNAVTLHHPKLLVQPTTVVVADVCVEVGLPPPDPSNDKAGADAPLRTYVESGPRPVDMQVRLGADGALKVAVSGVGRAVILTTRISEPEGRWAATPEGNWTRATREASGSARWEGAEYRVEREVSVRADHVHIADTITNTSERLIGVMVEHRLELAGHAQPGRLLCGRRVYKARQTTPSPANPTALACWPELAVGLIAEDDIFRVHHESFSIPDAIGIADRKLGLAPGATHVLEWSVYPVPQGDYWDFINAVRRNWGSNFTIPGPSLIEPQPDGKQSAEGYGAWARKRGLAFAIAGQQAFADGYLAEGTAIPLATEWNAGFREWRSKLQQAAPECQALVYLHSQISTEPDAQAKYADCRVLDAGGKQLVSPYHYPVYLFLPRPDNAYGRALSETVRFILDDLPSDGIYNDCFTHDSAAYAWGLPWDGCTVEIDPTTHEVGKPYSSVVLLQQPWKVELARMVRERGKLLVGNGPPFTRTLQQLHVPTFTETNSFAFLVDTHLSAPWGLGTHSAEQEDRTRVHMARRMLDHGGVYSVYTWADEPTGAPFVRDFFPVTPRELRPGVVLAEERVLTNRSGRFGWPDGGRAEVHVYGADGRRVPEPDASEVEENGRRLTEVHVPPQGLAVLIRASGPP